MASQSSVLSPTTPDIKFRLLSLTPAEFAALRNAYHYRWVTSYMRSNGWLNLLLGSLTLWMAYTFRGQYNLKLLQAALGIIIVGQSLWALGSPTVKGIQRFAMLLFVCGLGNILIGGLQDTRGGLFLGVLFGGLQLWWASQTLSLYQRFAPLNPQKPSPETEKLYDDVWYALKRGSFADDPDYVELQIRRRWWRGFLIPGGAVLAFKKSKTVIFAEPADVVLVPGLSKPTDRWVDIVLKLDVVSASGKIRQQFFQRYNRWKGIENTLIPAELSQMRQTRRIVRWVAIIILAFIALVTVLFTASILPYV